MLRIRQALKEFVRSYWWDRAEYYKLHQGNTWY
jgi:hypothetical protein